MLEKKILAACFQSREAYERLRDHLDPKSLGPQGALISEMISAYYDRDVDARRVDPDVLIEKLPAVTSTPKQADILRTVVLDLASIDVSAINVADAILQIKRADVGNRLASLLLSNKASDKIDEAIAEWKSLGLGSVEDVSTLGEEVELVRAVDARALVEKAFSPEKLIRLYPRSLNDRVDGGVLPAHHIVVFARPEIGKTALAISMAAGFARQGLPGVYFGNEEPTSALVMRFISNLSGMTRKQVMEDPDTAMRIAMDNGYENVTVAGISPGNLSLVDRILEETEAKWSVIDQLRNMTVPAKNKVDQLDIAAQGHRNVIKARKAVGISLTQAGDSATNKLVLDMGDVDYSNTGIPASADVLIGVGANEEYINTGHRMISLPKNKISNDHTSFPIRINPPLSRCTSV